MTSIREWFIPSFHGDIRLTSVSASTCRLIAEKLSAREREALRTLTARARSKKWIEPDASFSEGEVLVRAPIGKVSVVLARALKAGRRVVSAVRFIDGKIEEVTEAMLESDPEAVPSPETATATAASVAVPVRGCPAPDFVAAEIRAACVLARFLDPDQLEDFQDHDRFITRGIDTGHQYMVTSRYNRDALARWQRTLYDLDEERPLCVHDWVVPAAEEMLSLHLLLQIPGWESYLRRDEHDFDLLATEAAALALAVP